MCLAVPARIISLDGDDLATVSLDGVRVRVNVALIDTPCVGDYVIVHVGYALNRLDPDEADRTLALLAEIGIGSGLGPKDAVRDPLEANPTAP